MLYQQMLSNPSQRAVAKDQTKKGLCNIFENENEWTLDLLVPGYTKSDFSMDVKDGVLKITGAKKDEERKFIKKEFGSHGISRTFTLPKNIDIENITAKLNAGILSIAIPKSEEAKPKTINIK